MFFHLNKHSVGLLKRLHLQWHRDAQRCTEMHRVSESHAISTLSTLLPIVTDSFHLNGHGWPGARHSRGCWPWSTQGEELVKPCEALFTCLPCSNFAQYFDVFCSMTWTQQSSLCSWIKITPAAWVCRSLQTCRFLFCWANEGFRFEWRLLLISLDYVMLPEPLVENGGIWNNDLADNWQITRSMGQSCALCCLVDAWYNGHDRKVKLRLEASFELSSRTGDGPTPSRQNAGNVNISTDPNCRFMSILLFWCSQGYKAFGWLSRASLMYLFA